MNKTTMRASFIFYSSYYDAISELPPEEQGQIYKAIIDYGIAQVEPTNLTPAGKMCFKLIRPTIDAALSRYDASVENGKKGGRPTKNPQETQGKPSQNLEETHTKPTNNLKQTQIEPSQNLNKDIDMDMDIDVDLDIKQDINFELVNKNKFNNCIDVEDKCGRVRERTPQERQPYIDFYKEHFNFCFGEDFKAVSYEIVDTMIEAREQAIIYGLKFDHRTIGGKEFTSIIANINVDQFRSIVTQLKFNEEIVNRPYYILGCIMYASADKTKVVSKEQMQEFMMKVEG